MKLIPLEKHATFKPSAIRGINVGFISLAITDKTELGIAN